MYNNVSVKELIPDSSNPRKADYQRTMLLGLSLQKLGFILPIVAREDGLVLSGHQRLATAISLGCLYVPVHYVELEDKDIRGVNVLFNRVTNDFGALSTGQKVLGEVDFESLAIEAKGLKDYMPTKGSRSPQYFANNCKNIVLQEIASSISNSGVQHSYDKKAIVIAENFLRKGIHIPIVITPSGRIVNGKHRLFAAMENGEEIWPAITIPESLADFANKFLNYLSMDYHVDNSMASVLRYSAYRRPQNNRGKVPKAYRFWGNGCRTLPDSESYSVEYWVKFRNLHGRNILDFGAGLCKVAPFLVDKGMECIDFEPYAIDPASEGKKPSPSYSREKSKAFLEKISDSSFVLNSIFMASVLNSIPFPRDRMCALSVVHALCGLNTIVYGTCRHISDFSYEYSGIRQANYFVFDSEPGVRLGDALHNPKLQKFHSEEEFTKIAENLWSTVETWPGGNVFYWKLSNPKRINKKVLREAIQFEFDLPYQDGTTMGLVDLALSCFSLRLGAEI